MQPQRRATTGAKQSTGDSIEARHIKKIANDLEQALGEAEAEAKKPRG